MPLYTYDCKKCEEEFSEFASMDDYKKPQPCPECGEFGERTLTAPNIGVFSAMSPENQRASLMKRSSDHTAATVKKEGIPQFRKERKKERLAQLTNTVVPDKK